MVPFFEVLSLILSFFFFSLGILLCATLTIIWWAMLVSGFILSVLFQATREFISLVKKFFSLS